MPVTIKNSGTMLGYDTVNPFESTRRVVVEGIEYVIGPNMTTSFGGSANVQAGYVANAIISVASSLANNSLRFADNRDGDGLGKPRT